MRKRHIGIIILMLFTNVLFLLPVVKISSYQLSLYAVLKIVHETKNELDQLAILSKEMIDVLIEFSDTYASYLFILFVLPIVESLVILITRKKISDIITMLSVVGNVVFEIFISLQMMEFVNQKNEALSFYEIGKISVIRQNGIIVIALYVLIFIVAFLGLFVKEKAPAGEPVFGTEECMFCPNCGNKLKTGAQFCGQCGYRIQ